MAHLDIPLVDDPVLRRSLRQLYRDLPGWIQRWTITTPGRGLPRPEGADRPEWQSAAAARAALQATCDAVNAAQPRARWTVQTERHRDEHAVWAGPPDSHWNGTALHRAADGMILRCAITQKGGKESVTLLTTQTHGTTLSLSAPEPRMTTWILGNQGRTINGTVAPRDGHAARYVVFESIYADGTSYDLRLDERGKVQPTQTAVYYTQGAELELARLAGPLLERWRAVPSAADRARIAQFWLGHPHPVLAAAGLQAMSSPQQAPNTGRW
jgi:hypothetical protein